MNRFTSISMALAILLLSQLQSILAEDHSELVSEESWAASEDDLHEGNVPKKYYSDVVNVQNPSNINGDVKDKEDDDDDKADVFILICTQSFTAEELVEDVLLDRLYQEPDASLWNIKVELVDAAGMDWTEESLQQETDTALQLTDYARSILVVASTYGDGDPPNHATEFADWLARRGGTGGLDVNEESIISSQHSSIPFAVFGLGDSSYAHYCEFGKFIDQSLGSEYLQGNRLLPFHDGDTLADQSGAFRQWSDQVAVALSQVLKSTSFPREESSNDPPKKRQPFSSTGFDWRRSAIQQGSTNAEFLGAHELLLPPEGKEDSPHVRNETHSSSHDRSILHVALRVPTDKLAPLYDELQPGDHVGLYPRNPSHLVQQTLEWLGIKGDMMTKLMERRGTMWTVQEVTAWEFLSSHVDLAGRATTSALRALLPFVGTLELRALARDLTFVETKQTTPPTIISTTCDSNATEDGIGGHCTTDAPQSDEENTSPFDHWLAGRRWNKLDLAMHFECRPSLQALARAIGPMQPRLYSIATIDHETVTMKGGNNCDSSYTNSNCGITTIGLCMAVADGGLATNYIANLAPGSRVTIFVRKSQFHYIPDDYSADSHPTPTWLVGAGSGIGPFVGFLQQEQRRLEAVRTVTSADASTATSLLSHFHLCVGCRSPSDIIYKDELSSFQQQEQDQDGGLGAGVNIHYAFSRVFGQPKQYVPDVLRAQKTTVFKDVFENKGRVYACGRLEICTGVKDALVEVAVSVGEVSSDMANQMVEAMEKEKRLLTDCWSVDSYQPPTNQQQAESLSHPPHVLSRLERHHITNLPNQSSTSLENDVDLSNIPAWPSYLRLMASGEFERRIEYASAMHSACVACGRFCEVNRISANHEDWGECRLGQQAIVSAHDAHFGEEDCLRGIHGSGTIFFGSCNLKCMYCQNWQISHKDRGDVVDDEQLANIMLELQDRGCHNINLVSPTHNVLAIVRGIYLAAQKGLTLPIVWNTGGYDSVASLRLLDGIIDIYMPDAKYASRAVARKLSKIDNYPEINQAAIKEMHRQVGALQIDPRTGLAWRGVLVRHLILPSDYAGTEDVASFLYQEVSADTYINVMPYYRPEFEAAEDTKYGMNRKPSQKEVFDAQQNARCAKLVRLHIDKRLYPNGIPGCPDIEDMECKTCTSNVNPDEELYSR